MAPEAAQLPGPEPQTAQEPAAVREAPAPAPGRVQLPVPELVQPVEPGPLLVLVLARRAVLERARRAVQVRAR
jgi:hypothetical protein